MHCPGHRPSGLAVEEVDRQGSVEPMHKAPVTPSAGARCEKPGCNHHQPKQHLHGLPHDQDRGVVQRTVPLCASQNRWKRTGKDRKAYEGPGGGGASDRQGQQAPCKGCEAGGVRRNGETQSCADKVKESSGGGGQSGEALEQRDCRGSADKEVYDGEDDSQLVAYNGLHDRPILVEKAHVIRLAAQYTPCAGCIAAVKALLKKPIHELRLLNAVMYEDEASDALRLREQYANNPGRTAQLLETFPLSSVIKKVQPNGVSLRCPVHRRAPHSTPSHNQTHNSTSHTHDTWEWEEAWDRLPAELREKVATIEIANLEAAMHHATATHRFCADCKHNVVTALDVLTGKYSLDEVENGDEYNPELFRPFIGRITPTGKRGPGGTVNKILACQVCEVEDLITWHEDFDSQEYTSSGQRHAATLEHGQREVRSIIGSLLLQQLKTCWHNHTAQVQAEQYLFCLVVHVIRTQLASNGFNPANHGQLPPAHGGLALLTDGTMTNADGHSHQVLSSSDAAARLLEELEGQQVSKKSKSKKKKERRAKAKAKRAQEEPSSATGPSAYSPSSAHEEEDDDDDAYDSPDGSQGRSSVGSHGHDCGAVDETESAHDGAAASSSSKGTKAHHGRCEKASAAVHPVSAGRRSTCGAATQARNGPVAVTNGASGPVPAVAGLADGMSLLAQLEDDDRADETDEIDPALLQEMEQLKNTLQAKADLQTHRASLRSKLAINFREYCILNH